MGVIFNIQSSQLFTSSSPTEEIFQVHNQNQQSCGKSSSCRFSLSAASNNITKVICNFRFFFSILVFLPFQESLKVTVCKRCGFLSGFLAAIFRDRKFRQTTVKDLPFIHQHHVARKVRRISTDCRYQTHVKKYCIFSFVLVRPFITPQFI